jgi:VWFA-related protein
MKNIGKFHILTLWMIGLFIPVVAQQDEVKIKIDTELINVDVIVNDRAGKRIPDLKKEDFEIYEDGVLQEITHFKPAPQPLRLVMLFDMSNSMEAMFPAIKSEAVKFVESLNQLDEMMVASFGLDLKCHTNWGGKALATNAILDLKAEPLPWRNVPPSFGGAMHDVITNLYGAMHTVFERFGGRSGNEVVLLFSDGVDSVIRGLEKQRPIRDSKQAIQEAQESWAPIYSACFKTERKKMTRGMIAIQIGGNGKDGYGSNCQFLSQVADASGGRSFEFESQPDLAQVLKKTLDELRSQYTLAYYPSSQKNRAGFHKIKVVVKKPDTIARAREGYLISK